MPANIAAAIADTNRPQADKDLDPRRKPAEMLILAGVKPGDTQEHRVSLDGSPSEAIEAKAKDLAAKRLARLAERETANEPQSPPHP